MVPVSPNSVSGEEKLQPLLTKAAGDYRPADAWDESLCMEKYNSPSKTPRRRLGKTSWEIKTFKRSCVYGRSEKATHRPNRYILKKDVRKPYASGLGAWPANH